MTGPRRAAVTALVLVLPLLCAVAVSVNSHSESTPSVPPPVRPAPSACPKPVMPPSIQLIDVGHDREQATRCAAWVDV